MVLTREQARNNQGFYVYLHRKATTGVVFYVGKGKGDRAWLMSRRNRHWHSIVHKHGLRVEVVEHGYQEWYALERERDLIAFYGRKNLCNKTDGGEGCSGMRHSQETRAILSEKHTGPLNYWYGRKQHPNLRHASLRALALHRYSRRGESWSEAHKQAISAKLMGHAVSEETRRKISESKRKSRPVMSVSLGMPFDSPICAADWLRLNGWPFAQPTHVRRACQGKASSAYGHKWEFINE